MTPMIGRFAILLTLGSLGLSAGTVYSNTTTDTLNTIFYSTGPYTELGDQIHLAGTDRQTTSAIVQFFNNGSTGTFDATLRFYQVGSPVGTQIGSDVVMTGISAPGGMVFNVTFNGLSAVVPTDLIFTVLLSNASAGTDIGLDMFEPPTIGSSDPSFYIAKQGSSFSQVLTPSSQDVFFSLNAIAAVPEPTTLALLGVSLFGIVAFSLRRRRT